MLVNQKQVLLLISAEQANGQMIITITDDGKGIPADKVALKALENGLIDENQYDAMTDNEKAMLDIWSWSKYS